MTFKLKPEQYPHKIVGLFDDETRAREMQSVLTQQGIEEKQIFVIGAQQPHQEKRLQPETQGPRDTVIRDLLAGAGIGGGTGVVASAALGAASLPLVVASPVAATLLAATYGATIGGLAGGIHGLRPKETQLAAMAQTALQHGHWVLVVHARDEEQADQARELVEQSASESA